MGQPTTQWQAILQLINNMQAQLNAIQGSQTLPLPSPAMAGNFAVVNGAGGGYVLVPLSGDVVSSNSVPGKTTVQTISSLIPQIASTQNNSPFQPLAIVAGTTAVNAQLGDNCYLILTASTTIAAPANPRDGQTLTFLFSNNAVPEGVTWNPIFTFQGSNPPAISASAYSVVAFKYVAALNTWVELYRALQQSVAVLAFYYGPPPPIAKIVANNSPWLGPIPYFSAGYSSSPFVFYDFWVGQLPPIPQIIANWTPRIPLQ